MAKPLVIDNSLYVSLAARLARDQPVAYFSSWNNAFPVSREFAPGTGIPNVERVDDPISFMLDGKASHVIVPDLYLNGYETLARRLEIPTWGSNGGNQLELDRWHLKEFLAEHDLPVNFSVKLEGMDNLAAYLKEHDDKYVKISVFRGDRETVHHVNWQKSQYDWFNRLRHRLGKVGETIPFIVEDPIPDALEIGIDTFVRGSEFLSPMALGLEKKGDGYFGWIVDEIPEQFGPVAQALSGYFAEHDYCNFFSNEMRIRNGEIYMIDATCRIPSPPGGVMMAAIENFPKVILDGKAPDYGDAKYLYEIILKSDPVAEEWLNVTFPDEFADRYEFRNYCVRDGQVWIIPHDSKYVEFGSALGWGKSKDAAREMCIEAANAVKAEGIRFDDDVLKEAEEEATENPQLLALPESR